MIPLEVEERDQPQRSTLRLSEDFDVLQLHNLCSCQGTDQPDKLPGINIKNILASIKVERNCTIYTGKICLPPLHSEIW